MEERSKFVRKYRKDPRFYLVYKYRDMLARVNGRPVRRGYDYCPWKGMGISERSAFIEWALEHPDFQRLWREWRDSNFSHRGPTVHRINRDEGYLLENIQWMSHAEKSRMALGLDKTSSI